jgi:hypothetical protein
MLRLHIRGDAGCGATRGPARRGVRREAGPARGRSSAAGPARGGVQGDAGSGPAMAYSLNRSSFHGSASLL